MKRAFAIIGIFFGLILIILLGMKIAWLTKESKVFAVYILDKTVTQPDRNEHKSLVWLLNQQKYVLPSGKQYSHKKDYYGFFPLDKKEGLFEVRSIRINDIEEFVKSYDMLFYADCFGVHSSDWFQQRGGAEKNEQRLYGGLNQNDFMLMKEMLNLGKPVILEYNLFSLPTNPLVRAKAEELLDIDWTGWSGKYFSTFDVEDEDGPSEWLKNLYESQQHGIWPQQGSGILFYHQDGLIFILEQGKHLNTATPTIITETEQANRFGLKNNVPFEQWFEYNIPGNNQVNAHFKIDVTEEGKETLEQMGLDEVFPAIIEGAQLNYFYFCGNFSDNPSKMCTAKLAGGKGLNKFLTRFEHSNASTFYHKFYIPLVETIIQEQVEGFKANDSKEQ